MRTVDIDVNCLIIKAILPRTKEIETWILF